MAWQFNVPASDTMWSNTGLSRWLCTSRTFYLITPLSLWHIAGEAKRGRTLRYRNLGYHGELRPRLISTIMPAHGMLKTSASAALSQCGASRWLVHLGMTRRYCVWAISEAMNRPRQAGALTKRGHEKAADQIGLPFTGRTCPHLRPTVFLALRQALSAIYLTGSQNLAKVKLQ